MLRGQLINAIGALVRYEEHVSKGVIVDDELEGVGPLQDEVTHSACFWLREGGSSTERLTTGIVILGGKTLHPRNVVIPIQVNTIIDWVTKESFSPVLALESNLAISLLIGLNERYTVHVDDRDHIDLGVLQILKRLSITIVHTVEQLENDGKLHFDCDKFTRVVCTIIQDSLRSGLSSLKCDEFDEASFVSWLSNLRQLNQTAKLSNHFCK